MGARDPDTRPGHERQAAARRASDVARRRLRDDGRRTVAGSSICSRRRRRCRRGSRTRLTRTSAIAHRPAADLSTLTYAEQVIDESWRLYPPAWAFTRSAVEADAIDGHQIPKHAIVVLSPYVNHRHPRFWPEPERFDPDRFAPRSRDPGLRVLSVRRRAAYVRRQALEPARGEGGADDDRAAIPHPADAGPDDPADPGSRCDRRRA